MGKKKKFVVVWLMGENPEFVVACTITIINLINVETRDKTHRSLQLIKTRHNNVSFKCVNPRVG